jgi:hypothetical protein
MVDKPVEGTSLDVDLVKDAAKILVEEDGFLSVT